MNSFWQRFVNGEPTSGEIDPIIYRSWERCRESDVDFKRIINNEILPVPQLREKRQAHVALIDAGKNILPFLVRYLKGRNYIVLLCDREGYILDALGDPPFMNKAQRVHLSPGANWGEEIKGTNAIGTVLKEQAPVKVLGWEHFVRENQFLNCWAAPIKNSNGESVGVLDISGEAGSKEDRLVEILLMGARMIEQNLQVIELQENFSFCREGIKLAGELLREGFVTINSRGEIVEINQAGVKLLGYSRQEVIGRQASDVFQMTTSILVKGQGQQVALVEKPEFSVSSRFSQVLDDKGQAVGAVGVLQPAVQHESNKTQWVGRSELTRKVFKQAAKAAESTSTVLIQGESGTGKEVVARYIHQLSSRGCGPFVALNCAAIPATLIESELFGYADGSFTGAKRGGQPGKFEAARDGTIFFDEIGDMPQDVQASLLRVLQEKEIYRIGDTKTRKVNARVIAATNKDLKGLVDAGHFRLDLYYRLKVITIEIPSLRERINDILDLAPYFLNKICDSAGRRMPDISDAVYSRLLSYTWPGNIRELENCIESMIAMTDGSVLTEEDMPEEIRGDLPVREDCNHLLLEEQTKQAIIQALMRTKGKVAPAARILGIGRTTLYRKMDEFNIKL